MDQRNDPQAVGAASCEAVRPEFVRTALLAGAEGVGRLQHSSVIIFGVGGVGSWCVEALARTGVGHITTVDSDTVVYSNINRQLPALHSTVGRYKAEVLSQRIADINPTCRVDIRTDRYTAQNASSFGIENYDYAIDAIDSLDDKADLILRCTDPAHGPRRAFFSSMGAARKADSAAIDVAEFWKVHGCPLARALRTRFRRSGNMPQTKFKCVYSPETLPQQPGADANGTFMHITAQFGLRLAGLVINACLNMPANG